LTWLPRSLHCTPNVWIRSCLTLRWMYERHDEESHVPTVLVNHSPKHGGTLRLLSC
jgi:hypothetical protein